MPVPTVFDCGMSIIHFYYRSYVWAGSDIIMVIFMILVTGSPAIIDRVISSTVLDLS